MGSGKGGGGGKSYDYFGDIAGVVCAGPVDELLAILVDGHTVWPTATAWASGQSISTGDLRLFQETTYKALSNHTSSGANQPPNGTYWVRYSVPRTGSPNPLPITVQDFGAAYFYWGTSSQTLDSVGEAFLTAQGHPPYRNLAVIVLKQFLFGRERVTPPNVEVVVRRAPRQSLITGTSANLSDGQANPLTVLAEAFTDPIHGAGLPIDASGGVDSTTWQSAADAMAATGAQTDISPVTDQGSTLRSFTSQLLGYCDGWLRFNVTGEIEAGRFAHNAAPPSFTPATTIDYHDLTEEASFDSGSWGQVSTQAFVRFTDRTRAFKDGSVSAASGSALSITGNVQVGKVDRPWINRRQQAQDHCAEWLKINSEPKVAGSLTVRAEKATSIRPGDLFLFTHDALAVSYVCRCVGKTTAKPPAGRATISFEVDRASAPVPYQPTPTPPTGSAFPDFEAFGLYQFFQPPPAMVGASSDAIVVPLIARALPLTVACNVWLQQADLSLFKQLGTVTQFGITGTLQTTFSAVSIYATSSRARASGIVTLFTNSPHLMTPGMTITVYGLADSTFNGVFVILTVGSNWLTYACAGANVSGVSDFGGTVDLGDDDVGELLRVTLNGATNAADLSRCLATQTEDSISDTEIAVVVFKNSDRTVCEVMALRSMRIVGGDAFYRLKVRRQRYGTAFRTAVTGDPCWIIPRANLKALTSEAFPAMLTALSPATFRLQSISAAGEADVSDTGYCPNIAYQFVDPYAPVFTFVSVRASGTEISNFATNYTSATVFSVTAKITDSSADLVEGRLFAKLGALEVTLWNQTFTPCALQQFDTQFTLPNTGEWSVFLAGKDRSGRVRVKALTAGGGSSTVTLKIGVGSTGAGSGVTVASPTAATVPELAGGGGGYKSSNVSVTLACSTSGSTIKYQVVTLGAVAGGTWTTYSGEFVVSAYQGKTVYAYALKAGMTDSPVVSWNYWKEGRDYIAPGTQAP